MRSLSNRDYCQGCVAQLLMKDEDHTFQGSLQSAGTAFQSRRLGYQVPFSIMNLDRRYGWKQESFFLAALTFTLVMCSMDSVTTANSHL
ncbi:hypothetical protein POSPLADRAFT_1040438 [Postia placenta MAD-698-R-SB12]|uniref:Uncharacterized protein n=1 Tax=Postia placenta MAD-698-R-SB12 TaxID=670580 RepID=A0A1X6MYL3_9APHY|nr:hypothetical protein POSPLADRAFT_1040438 [Postia placenta MAD-698-R-SB12]OSX61332.1 hypothetical protein POSPLADRAFT_1040438 [Postia placenta MAD-698-R-SB12]